MTRWLLAGTAVFALGACAHVTAEDVENTAALAEPALEQDAMPQVTTTVPVPNNPLLAEWTGPYGGVPPWDKVRPELFTEAFQFGIDEQRREIAAIVNNPAAPTFDNTIAALEKSGERLGNVQTLFGVMTNNMASPAIQAVNREWSPKLSAASDEIRLNPQLFQRIKALYDARDSAGYDAKQHRLVTRYYESFVRNGANLNPEQKQQLSAINQ